MDPTSRHPPADIGEDDVHVRPKIHQCTQPSYRGLDTEGEFMTTIQVYFGLTCVTRVRSRMVHIFVWST